MAQAFRLRSHQEVRVRVISDPVQGGVCLDHVEIIFRDQYLRRSDMWRIKLQLLDNCAFAEMQVACASFGVLLFSLSFFFVPAVRRSILYCELR